MPNYDYMCASCGEDFEFFQSMNDHPLTLCPSCEEPSLKRKIGRGAGIIFKGSGFYETDYKKPAKESGTAETKASAPKSEKGESASKGGCGDSGGCGCAS